MRNFKYLFAILLVSSLAGCGWLDRKISALTGSGSETCQDHVVYLQFTSGVSVKYSPDGKIVKC